MKKETVVIKELIAKSQYRENSVPIYLTSSFSFDSAEQASEMFADKLEGNIYSRFSNPNNSDLIEKLCQLEGTEFGLTTASGMAATFAVFAGLLKHGDHIITPNGLFGSTHQVLTKILPNYGISHDYVDINDINTWKEKLIKSTKICFIESPTNPSLDIVDLEKASLFCKAHNLLLIVDNTFSTPLLQKPIQLGADIVLHSATKFLDGQGRALGGVILGQKDTLEPIRFFLRQTGPSMSPFNAWILSKSIETLSLRIERQSSNALYIAKELDTNTHVKKVVYPFLKSHPHYNIAKKQMVSGGSIISLYLNTDIKGVFRFLNALKHIVQTANLGDVKTLITHPYTTTHSKLSDDDKLSMKITDNLIRLSIGIEDKKDLLNDIKQAFDLI